MLSPRPTEMDPTTLSHAEAQRARRGWAVSLGTLRLCVILFREGGLQAHMAATIGFGAKHSMRIRCKALLILRFSYDSALSEALKPQGTYAQPNRYPVSTHGKPRYSGGLHFFVIKLQMAVDRIPKSL